MIKKKNKIKNIHLKGNVPCDIVENSSIASSTLPMEKKYDPIDRRKKLFLNLLIFWNLLEISDFIVKKCCSFHPLIGKILVYSAFREAYA